MSYLVSNPTIITDENGQFIARHTATQPYNVMFYGAKGDGITDDTAAIQAAIDAASAGDTIHFPSGTYVTDKLTITSKTNINLSGYGATLKRPVSINAAADHIIDVATSDRINIFGFTFDAENSTASGVNRAALDFLTCNDCHVRYVHFADVRTGVDFRDCLRCGISDSTAEQQVAITEANETNQPLQNYFAVIQTVSTGCKYCFVDNCRGNGVRIALDTGASNQGNSITNNKSHETADSVIYFSNGTQDFVCMGNVVFESGKDCIKAINGCIGGTITGNSAYWSGEVVTNSVTMIQVDDSEYITISGNYVKCGDTTRAATSQIGVLVQDSNHITVNGNAVWMDTTTGGSESGIRVQTSANATMENIVVSDNTVYGLGNYGIIVINGAGETITDVAIRNNVIKGFSTATSDFGIALLNNATGTFESIDVVGNKISNVQQGGIYLTDGGTLTNIYIAQNTFRDMNANAECIYATGTGTGTYQRVIVENNHQDGTSNLMFQSSTFSENYITAPPNNTDNGIIINHVRNVDGTTVTSPHTLQAWDSGIFVDNTGATGSTTVNLPAAIAGMEFTISRVATQTMLIDPNGTEQFRSGGTLTTAGKYKSFDSDDAFLALKCYENGIWEILASDGTISDEP